MKCAPLSLATAFAIKVLPVPGGPYSKTPLGGSMPSFWKSSGCRSGSSIVSLSRWSSSFKPPISSYENRLIPSKPAAGLSENSIVVFLVMMTASSGSISMTLNATIWGWRNGSPSMIGTESFIDTGKSISPLTTCGLLATGIFFGRSSGGASTIRLASTSSVIFMMVTESPIATPAFCRVKLSIRTLRWFQSSTRARQTLATVRRFPSIATRSPGEIFNSSIVSGSSRAFPPP